MPTSQLTAVLKYSDLLKDDMRFQMQWTTPPHAEDEAMSFDNFPLAGEIKVAGLLLRLVQSLQVRGDVRRGKVHPENLENVKRLSQHSLTKS